jgi:hypothetical protein
MILRIIFYFLWSGEQKFCSPQKKKKKEYIKVKRKIINKKKRPTEKNYVL